MKSKTQIHRDIAVLLGIACVVDGAVYRIAVEDNLLVVEEVAGQQADGLKIIVAPMEAKTLH
ncbi:hypothetical protein QAO71_16940 (plasmid) [Halopseudomonas sp. SMJS2]|uniref:hypothetical protein n=1 Tax=Halopseudomonas sp. SMJS2 TaxID=3041098 RepID=UPI0024528703|nr:hypothetical protein [Halopseudomonas sp. SMJS2]WGK63457.1 hypothetical protein QAO71_16940 [Halopseudomonas sp. SMJS2]